MDEASFRLPETALTFNATQSLCEHPDTTVYDRIESGDFTVHDG